MRQNSLPIFLVLVAIFLFFLISYRFAVQHPSPAKSEGTELREGDIIFQTSQSLQSKAVQLATHSAYSHMGVLYKHNGQLFVYEAIQTVQLTPLQQWIDRGEGRHYVVKRLVNSAVLNNNNMQKLRDEGENFKGKEYDPYFGWSDDKIYCSELVWKMYKNALGLEIGQLQELRSFDLTDELVKSKIKERYGEAIPLDEKVISPAAMFESPELKLVMSE